ncbi:MAG: hypothetical protein OHK0040_02380 [bacterium]
MAKVIGLSEVSDIKSLLKKALEEKIVDAILGLFWMPSRDMLTLALSSQPEEIDNMEIMAPVMPVQAARVISNIKFTESKVKVICVVKPCELRASVELIKLKQIVPENLLFLSYDCGGAIGVDSFKDMMLSGKNPVGDLLQCNKVFIDFTTKTEETRFACTVCDKFIPKLCDLRLRSFGEKLYLEALTHSGEEVLNLYQPTSEESVPDDYDQKVLSMIEMRSEKRAKEKALFKREVNSIEAITKELSSCIRCHNCMTNCPLDYCKECIFKTPVFDHPVENYEIWLNRKGTIKLPTDTLLFHLTRLNHMSSSCVSCGCCESACPVGIKVSRIFMFLGEEVQKIFDYEPGRNLEEALPVATFREKELDKI